MHSEGRAQCAQGSRARPSQSLVGQTAGSLAHVPSAPLAAAVADFMRAHCAGFAVRMEARVRVATPPRILITWTAPTRMCFPRPLTPHSRGARAVATDGASTGDTVEGYGTWDVGASDPFSHWFRSTETAPDGVAANVSSPACASCTHAPSACACTQLHRQAVENPLGAAFADCGGAARA
jgi:hypothetical protein